MDMGKLIPITWYEALPGDTIQQSTAALVRVSPLLSPVMHPVVIRLHHWFVPNRLIWEDWEEFITGGPEGTSTPTHPYRNLVNNLEGSLFEYLGVPPATYSPSLQVNALPLRAYQKIWNENYRDQDLVTEATIDITAGSDSSDVTLQNISWEKDYFTTARPWEQKGDEVVIPYSGEAPVTGIGALDTTYGTSSQAVYETEGSGTTTYANAKRFDNTTASVTWYGEEDPSNSGYPNIRADLSGGAGIPINDLRLAMAVQKFQERMGRSGSRYSEYLRYLGVKSSDARLQEPEYLGGGRQVISFSEVLSTDSGGSDPVGTMKGHGISAMKTNRYRRFFEEHGIVMTLMSVVPKAIYGNAIQRGFLRQVKEDYFQRELQNIGEQEITNKEIFTEHSSPDDIFGYQGRYDEYRHMPSGISSEFHSTLNHWHYARQFASDPSLNSTFVQATPTKRVNASSSTDCLYVMANHSIQARRMINRKAIPKL